MLAFAGVAHAQSYTWNVTTGDWNTAANWSPAQVPLSTGTVTINSSRTATIAAGDDVGASEVRLGYGYNEVGALVVNGTLTTGTSMVVGWSTNAGGPGTGTLTLGDNARVVVGGDLGFGYVGRGFFSQGANSTVSIAGNLDLRNQQGSSTTYSVPTTGILSFTGAASELRVAYGYAGRGDFIYSNPTVTLNVPGSVRVAGGGNSSGPSIGSFTLSDNTRMTVGGILSLGEIGNAVFNQGANTSVTVAGNVDVGGSFSSSSYTVPTTGTLTLTGPAANLNVGSGYSGAGAFTYANPSVALTVPGNVTVGIGTLAAGTFVLVDNTQMIVGGNLTLGNSAQSSVFSQAANTSVAVGGSISVAANSRYSVTSGTVRANGISGAGAFTAAAGMLAPWNADTTVSVPMTLTGTSFTFDSADKDGVGRTLTLSGSLALNGLQLVKTGLGTLSLSGTVGQVLLPNGASVTAGTLRVDRTAAATFTGTISGAGSFQKSGAGTLALTAANTYTGTTTLSGGVLQITSDANIGGTAAPLLFDGGTLGIAGTSLTSLAAGRTTSFAATKTVGFAVADAANTFTVSQALDQTTGGLAVTGPGTLVLAGANTYSGTTSVTGGGLRLDYGTSDTSKLSNTAALTLTGATVTLEGGSHTEAVGSTTLAAGRTTISRSGGSATLQTGTITRSSGGALDVAESGLLLVSNTNTNGIVGGWLTVGGSSWGVNSTNAANGPVNALTSYFTSTSGSLGSTTANTTMAADTTVGTTSINSLRFADAAARTVTGSAASTLTLSSGGILVAPSVGANTSTITGATVTAGATNLVVNQFNTSGLLAIDSVVGGSGGVFKTGAGALSLGGSAANTFTGGLSVWQGEVQLAKSGAVNAIASGSLTIGSGGSVRYTGASTDMIANAVAIQLNGSGFLDFAGATDTVGAVTVNATNAGANAQVLRNTGAGGTLTASSLTVTPDDGYATTLGSGSGLLVLNGAGQFNVNGSGRTVIAGGLSLGNGNRTFTVNDGLAADDLTISAAISSGTLTKAGDGTLVLSGSNAHTMALSAGRLDLNNAYALGTGTFTISASTILGNSSGAAITNLGNNAQAWNGDFTYAGPNALDLGTGAVTMNAARIVTVTSGSLTVGGTISGAGLSLTKQGPGTLVLSASNAYTGVTNLGSSGGTDGGILRLTGNGRISNAATTVFAGTLDMTGINQSVTTLTLGGGVAGTAASVLTGSGTLTLGGNVTYTATNNPGGGTIAGNLNLNNAARTFDVGNSTAAAADLTVSANITSGTLTKSGSGTLVLSGSNSFAAGTLSLGQLDVNNAHALGTGTFTISAASTLGNSSGAAVTNLGNNAQAWNADFTFAGPNDLNLGTGAVTMNANRTVTVASNTLTVGGTISGASRNLTKAGPGRLVLTAANTYTGTTTITEGTLAASTIGAGGSASPLGTSATAINLGSGTLAGFLGYTGSGETATRGISLVGNRGGLDALGSGALNFNGPLTAAGTKTLVLTGTSTADNRFSTAIAGVDMSVEKTGVGTWLLSGANSFGGSAGTGRLNVLAGTLVADGNAPDQGSGVFGAQSSLRPIVGAADATGSAALLVGAGYTVSRAVEIAAAGTGTQEAILGGMGAGVSEFDNLSAIYLGRSALTLAADSGNEARFYNAWLDGSGGGSPAAAFNVGTSLLSGTVGLMSFVPDSITAVNVRNGTLRLAASGGETLGFATQVTVGSGLGSATLNLANAQQSLASLRFSGSAGTVAGAGAGGVLKFSNNGAPAAVAVLDGTGHDIQSAVALLDATTFNVAAGGRLGVSGAISGGSGFTLTKTGLGRLDLSAANTYSGNTTVSAGRLVLGTNGSFAASSAIIVGDAGSSDAVLDLTAKTGGYTFGPSQTLGGGGRLELASSGTLTVAGLFSPGNSPGLFTYDGGTTLLTGTTLMEIFGTSRATLPSHGSGFYDAVNVVDGGILTLGGNLQLTFSSLFADDTTFDLFSRFDTATLAGNFTSVNVTGSFYNGLVWTQPSNNLWKSSETAGGQGLEFNATTGTLAVVIVVPEPGALALAGVGVALAVWTLRRRRR